jgi:hypothetical protein
MRVRNLAVVAFLIVPTLLVAQGEAKHGADVSIGVRSGTLGFGVEISKLVTSHIGLRVGANVFSLSRTFDQSDVTFSAKLKMKAVTGLVDLYPGSRGSFHLTGGIISNPLEVTGTGTPKATGTYTINNQEYTNVAVGTLTGSAKWPSTSPYLGFGFGTPANSHGGIKFVMDIGAAISKPTIALTATGEQRSAAVRLECPDREDSERREQVRRGVSGDLDRNRLAVLGRATLRPPPSRAPACPARRAGRTGSSNSCQGRK